jgi:glycosyltransferase involved in cell wall biosynthesis
MKTPEPGLAHAVNAGIATSRAPWIARMDADDVSLPHRLERQLDVLASNPSLVALGGYAYLMGETGRIVGQSRMGPTTAAELEHLRAQGELVYILQPSAIFSRAAGNAVDGYRQSGVPAEDVEFFSRLADDQLVLALPEPLLLQRIQSKSTSTLRFQELMEAVQRIQLNMARRRAGQPELTAAEFRALRQADSAPVRWRRSLRWRSQLYYRRGGQLLAAGYPRGAFWLLGSLALYPPLPLRRLRMQRVLSTVRASPTVGAGSPSSVGGADVSRPRDAG